MSEECPNCGRGSVGSQIVELPIPHTDYSRYGIICPCGVVYHSEGARKQIEGEK